LMGSLVPESLEQDCFPKWLRQGKRIAVLRNHAPFIDIGTPESLAEAARFIESNEFFSLVR
jgi:D-glycero-alpha-D-manno-heptose 1-phosphate guanylyltransferase